MSKRHQSAQEALKSVHEKLASAANSSAGARSHDVLQQVADLLSRGRGYSWVGIYLAVEDSSVAETSNVAQSEAATDAARSTRFRESKSEMVVPIRIGESTLGMIDVESESANALSRQERVLLGQVAAAIAQYLTTGGKRPRRPAPAQAASTRPQSHPKKGPQSARPVKRRAAAGEHSKR